MPMIQMIDACLPVGYSFRASIHLFRGYYTIHANHSHTAKWLSLTVVPIIYLSIFERIYVLCRLSPIVVEHANNYYSEYDISQSWCGGSRTTLLQNKSQQYSSSNRNGGISVKIRWRSQCRRGSWNLQQR